MKMHRLFVCLFVLFTPLLSASDSYEQELSSALVGRFVVLRNFYIDSQLKFDKNGNIVSKAKPGFGLTDGRLYVKRVQLSPGKLVLTGLRPINVFNQAQQRWDILNNGKLTDVEIELPNAASAKTSVANLLNTVFFKQGELAAMKCSAEEQQEFSDDLRNRLNHVSATDASKPPDASSLDELHPYCLPGGEHAYRVGRGVSPPRAKHTPDPSYDEAAKDAKLQGTSVLMAIVTPDGNASAISIQRSLGSGLDSTLQPLGQALDLRAAEAVSKWKFEPARFQGKAVPVFINVEVNFRLY